MSVRLRRLARAAGWPIRTILLAAIGLYQLTVGSMVAGRCRFHPSCSSYAKEAIRTHGAAKGSVLTLWRLLRCSPLTSGGLDPVPEGGRWRARPAGTDVR